MAGYNYADNTFIGTIDHEGVIWEAGTGRKRQAVGIDAQKEQEYQTQIADMQSVIDNYYGKLVELGVISPPKNAEQIAQEQAAQQAEINQKLLEAISGLQSEIKELRADGNAGNSNAISNVPVGEIGASVGKTGAGSQKRNATSSKDTA